MVFFDHRQAGRGVATHRRGVRLRTRMVGPGDYHRRNCVFENQLFLAVGFKYHGVLIEALNAAGKFHSAHEINRQERFIFARIV